MNLPTQICLWEMSLKTVHFAIISFSNVEVLIVSSNQMKLSCYVCIRSVVVFPSRGDPAWEYEPDFFPVWDTTLTTLTAAPLNMFSQ